MSTEFQAVLPSSQKEGARLRWQSQPRQQGRTQDAWISSGGTSGGDGRRKTESSARTLRRSFPFCSFDGHYNFICAHHVQPAAGRRFNGARVISQLLNFLA